MYEYLNYEVYYCRQAFAAYLLRDVEHVIEIGGFSTSIKPFLKPEQTYLVVDPEISEPDGKTKIQATFQDHHFAVQSTNYGVVILGIQLLDMKPKDWKRLYRLINNSKTTVIEAPNWPESKRQLKMIKENTNKKQVWSVLMNLSANNLDTEFTRRQVVCLR